VHLLISNVVCTPALMTANDTPESRNSPLLDNGFVSSFPLQRIKESNTLTVGGSDLFSVRTDL
jgi:hypothetical protein